ncbi:MAG: polysaccharide deacetylase family protein [Ignavibacteriaceae bacterium]|nr:polysaccharide deacetylase family protein [Ignavibacteriaceae bacterium]
MKILTVDLEDWFHILDFTETEEIFKWGEFETRIDEGLDYILSALSDTGYRATFFVLGWIAEKHPHVIKKILAAGYEIGNHSYSHLLIYKYKKEIVKQDILKSNKLLQDITGERIKYFRAPGFSIKRDTNWFFDLLSEMEIQIDSSIFPTSRGHGGYDGFSSTLPCKITMGGSIIKEFPINTFSLLRKNIVFSGGGYFRLLPYSIQKFLYKKSDYVMTYFHPRDFDYGQPILENLTQYRKFKSYVGLKNSRNKFEKLLHDFEFIDIKTANEQIDWDNAKTITL